VNKNIIRQITYLFLSFTFFQTGCLTFKKDTTPAEMQYCTIGTGGVNGVYYPVGTEISTIINSYSENSRLKAIAKTSYNASEFNIIDVLNKDLTCGISQADDLFDAYRKHPEGKQLRALFTLHTEAVTLLATQKSRIKSYKDLKGKRVRTGTSSNSNQDIKKILEAEGVTFSDLKQVNAKSVLCPNLIQKGIIDAYLFTVGHPNDNTAYALSGKNKVNIIPLSQQAIIKLLKKYPYYSRVSILLSSYLLSAKKIDTVGVKATFFTSKDADDKEIYNITKEIFTNLDRLIASNPALQSLKKKDMVKDILIPIHKGALRYYKEVGLKK